MFNNPYPGGFMNVNQQASGFQNPNFQMFATMFSRTSTMSPEETVKQMLKDGRMTNEQFQQFSQMANMIMGSKR